MNRIVIGGKIDIRLERPGSRRIINRYAIAFAS